MVVCSCVFVAPSIKRGSLREDCLPRHYRRTPEGWLCEFHVAICAEVISPTSVGRCGWTRRQLHTAVFEWRQGEVFRLRPDEGSIEDALSQEFRNFVSIVMQLTFKGCLRGVSTSCFCSGTDRTHIQSRTASWDRSGGSSGFCGDIWVCKFQTTQSGVNACVLPTGGFSGTAGFSVFELEVHQGSTHTRHGPNPVHALLPSFFRTLVIQSSGVRTLPAHASRW